MREKNKNSWNNYFPLELEREILARLPVKTLLQFRCVSKSWCSIIDSPDFNSLHLKLYNNNNNNNSENPIFIAINDFYYKSSITFRQSDTFKKIGAVNLGHRDSVCQICKGLLLTRDIMTMKLWNPSIKKCLTIPDCPIDDKEDYCCLFYKLGFAPSSNDYKVLAIKFSSWIIAVYSVNDHRWRVIRSNHLRRLSALWGGYNMKRHVVSGGAMYWVMCDDQSEGPVICVFDFDIEELRLLQPPDAVKESIVWFIFRFGESIAVFTMSHEHNCIWIMEKNGGSEADCNWRLWFTGEPNPDACSLFKSIKTEIFYVQKTNTFVMVKKKAGVRYSDNKVMCYNLINHEIKHLAKSLNRHVLLNIYVESLVLHKGIEGQTLSSFP